MLYLTVYIIPAMTENRGRLKKIPTGQVLFLSCILLLSGCVSLRQISTTEIKETASLNAFDGIYENPAVGKGDAQFSSLWNQLTLTEKIDTPDFQNARIGLKAVGKDKLKATWLQGDIEKKSVLLKGRLKDSYFVSRHKRTVIPIPLLYGQFSNNQFQLWLDKDSQLHADRLQNRWGWVFLFFAGKDDTRSYQYKKKTDHSALGQEARPFDTIMVEKTYHDVYGKNTLSVTVTNPCNEKSSIFDGPLTQIDARLKNEKGTTSLSYRHPHSQMSLIHFVKEEIHIHDLGGRKATIVPFYYCGGYESYDRKVSYIVFYENKNYIFHLDYYCGDGQDCKPVQSLEVTLNGLPKDVRSYLTSYLASKHKSKASFHQD